MTNPNDPINMAVGENGTIWSYSGLTKREYFAAMRNEPIFGNETLSSLWAEAIMGTPCPKTGTMENIKWWIEAHEKFAVMRADALIKALNEKL